VKLQIFGRKRVQPASEDDVGTLDEGEAQGASRESSYDFIDLKDIFKVWLKWSWVVVIAAAIGGYQGVRTLQSISPTYIASMKVLPEGCLLVRVLVFPALVAIRYSAG
jgi:hypothetical protein